MFRGWRGCAGQRPNKQPSRRFESGQLHQPTAVRSDVSSADLTSRATSRKPRPRRRKDGAMTHLPSLEEMARLLGGGEIVKGGLKCPGPGHCADDRSLSVTPSQTADCGFVVNSFAGDDVHACK